MDDMLRSGSTGERVRQLQSMLNGQPPTTLRTLAVDGIFGPLTRARVIEYQRHNGLAPDGIVGPLTWGKLKSKVKLVPASLYLRRHTDAVRTARPYSARIQQASIMRGPTAAFLIPVVPSTSTTFELGDLFIDDTPKMPMLPPLGVRIEGISPDPTPTTYFDWVVQISFDESECTCGKRGVTFNDGFIMKNVLGGSFSFVWPWIRGGDLTIAARGKVGSDWIEAIFRGRITGTNPSVASVRAELGEDIMRRIANHESGFHQFESDRKSGRIVPKFNRGRDGGPGDGGAGIGQITPPSPDDIWNWKANVKSAKGKFGTGRATALSWLNTHVNNGQYANDKGLSNSEAILWDAIQLYNGGHCWQWNSSENVWKFDPQLRTNPDYVAQILQTSP